MKNKLLITIAVCLGAIAFCLPTSAFAAEKKAKAAAPAASAAPATSPAASPAAAKAPRPIPFHGMVSAVDHKANTFTIAGKEKSRVFKITDKTVVTKGGAAATVKDIAEHQEVSGSYWKHADGSLEGKTVKIGPMKAMEKPKASAAPSASPKKP